MEQQLAQLMEQMRLQQQTMTDMLSRLQQSEVRTAAAEAAATAATTAAAQTSTQSTTTLAAAIGQAVATAMNVGQSRSNKRTMIDTRAVGKPQTYKSEEDKFRPWAVKFQGFVAGIFPGGKEALTWAADHEETITDGLISETWDDDASELEDPLDFSRQLHSALIGLMEGEALDIVVGTEDGAGLEAWRKLTKRFDPTTAGRSRNAMRSILNPGQFKAQELRAALEKWEQAVSLYCKRKDATGQRRSVPDDILMGILQDMGPQELRTHLQLNQSKFTTYAAMRAETVGYLEAKLGMKAQGKDDPMDIGGFGQRDNKAKAGKGGKGKGKGGEGKAKFEGYCNGCNKWGHKVADCWSGPGNSSSSKDKGKGKENKGKGKGKSDNKGKGKKGKGKSKGMASIEEWPWKEEEWWHEGWTAEEKPPEEKPVGALSLCSLSDAVLINSGNLSLCALGDAVQLNSFTGAAKEGLLEMTLDSGSAVSALHPEVGEEHADRDEPSNGSVYKTADGNEDVKDEGQRTLPVTTELWDSFDMKFRLTKVHKPLVSARMVVKNGNKIVLSAKDSYIEHTASGKRIPLYAKGGVYVFYVWLKPPTPSRHRKPKETEMDVDTQLTPEEKHVRFGMDMGALGDDIEEEIQMETDFYRQALSVL